MDSCIYWLLCYLLLTCLGLTCGEVVTLLRVDPSGKLWKTKVDPQGNGTTSSQENVNVPNFVIQNINVDNHGPDVLLDTINGSAILGNVCSSDQFSLNGGYAFNDIPNIGPFAVHNNIVYFLFMQLKGVNAKKILELRSSEGCEKYISYKGNNITGVVPLDSKTLQKCSTKIADIDSSSQFHISYKFGSNMKIQNKGGKKEFIFQIIKYAAQTGTGNRYIARSYLFHVTSDGTVRVLEDVEFASRFIMREISALLSVDWLEDTICWTSTDKVKCAELQANKLKNTYTVLNPGEGVIFQICTGEETSWLALITGIAITKREENMTVFFGCYAQHSKTGGVGMIRFTTPGVRERTIQKLKSSKAEIRGGSLAVVTEDQVETCDGVEVTTTASENTGAETSYVHVGSSSSQTIKISPLIMLLTSICILLKCT